LEKEAAMALPATSNSGGVALALAKGLGNKTFFLSIV